MISFPLLGIFVAVTFALWKEGLWGAAIMLLNTLLAATLATAWYEWVVALLKPRLPSYDYLLDFAVLWGLFSLLLLVFREIADRMTRTKVRFRRPVEMFGAPVVAAIAAWVTVCFTAASLHTAAVPRDLVQPTPETTMFFGLEPDRRWLEWVRGSTLRGPFAVAGRAFDPDADFILRYATRRHKLEAQRELRVPK
ncbi:MAG: hypothetical protein FJ286_08720 [Planctomycetes bacterium]|nr:hypothetical protein [Planctomycetota bacterium]